MSDNYDIVDLSMAFNKGHNDAWNKESLKEPPRKDPFDRKYQEYRKGFNAGFIARYYYDKGFADGQNKE